MIKLTLILVALLLLSGFSQARDVIRYQTSSLSSDANNPYFIKLLEQVLQRTQAQFGDYQIQAVFGNLPKARVARMLQSGELDLMWSATNLDLESQLAAVYVPLLKGMQGYRIFIIRADEQGRFDSVSHIQQLKQIKLGQGFNWNDVPILRHNGFNVIEGDKSRMLAMLKGKRFDMYPRGIYEPWREIKDKADFVVERSLYIRYPLPKYFFVSKQNSVLHQRLHQGLESMIDDGSFDAFFYAEPRFIEIFNRTRLDQRLSFQLINPDLSPASQQLVAQDKYWLQTK
ncbi:hypothetical protein C2869_22340 (plasmid) [Saccharobesus litoralis]|uniref:Solute-binding protein family 3/N-terminal domain-containing protein n=1 Tax=Saccharobesus litoralis TaxID=2172099 RepID=A0A2S0VYF5_9ALTE|nr:hypothetical protein [Saccharobesus litoralis]AWB69241.1 hypothetical protein C2869_22340 [Saccharobesus litoralis]